MKRIWKSLCRAHVRRRPRSYRLQLSPLEDRLPPGDVLAICAGLSLFGSSQVVVDTGFSVDAQPPFRRGSLPATLNGVELPKASDPIVLMRSREDTLQLSRSADNSALFLSGTDRVSLFSAMTGPVQRPSMDTSALPNPRSGDGDPLQNNGTGELSAPVPARSGRLRGAAHEHVFADFEPNWLSDALLTNLALVR